MNATPPHANGTHPGHPRPHVAVARSVPFSWGQFSKMLAKWTAENLVVRWDAFVYYLPLKEREKANTKSLTSKNAFTVDRLETHFAGKDVGQLMGIYPTKLDEATGEGEVAFCWSKWMAVDIDCHSDKADPAANLKAALAWLGRLVALGFTPLLIDSNGAGGYHLMVLLDAPIPTAEAYQFLQWLIADWQSYGLDGKPESFPKQPAIRAGGFGNVLRLPGRHHTRDHWTKVWDGERWLEGEPAIRKILGTTPSPKSILPPESIVIPPRPKPKPRPLGSDASWDLQCVDSALDTMRHMAEN